MTATTKRGVRLTADWLRSHDACAEEVEAFERMFPEGAAVTAANVKKAREAGLDVGWLVDVCGRIAPAALPEYWRAKGEAWAKYGRVTAPALAEYQRVTAPALAKLIRAALKECAS